MLGLSTISCVTAATVGYIGVDRLLPPCCCLFFVVDAILGGIANLVLSHLASYYIRSARFNITLILSKIIFNVSKNTTSLRILVFRICVPK